MQKWYNCLRVAKTLAKLQIDTMKYSEGMAFCLLLGEKETQKNSSQHCFLNNLTISEKWE